MSLEHRYRVTFFASLCLNYRQRAFSFRTFIQCDVSFIRDYMWKLARATNLLFLCRTFIHLWRILKMLLFFWIFWPFLLWHELCTRVQPFTSFPLLEALSAKLEMRWNCFYLINDKPWNSKCIRENAKIICPCSGSQNSIYAFLWSAKVEVSSGKCVEL